MSSLPYSVSQDISVTHEADVVVIGGGPGGLGAAVMAARNGAKTLLVERFGCLGGMATMGEVQPFMPNHVQGTCLDKPVYTEWLEQMYKYRPPKDADTSTRPGEYHHGAFREISKDVAMLAAEDLCLEAGVELLYHHTLVDAVVEDGNITAAVLHSKSGFSAVKGKQFVDATGDGDLAVLAGCEYEMGGPTGHCQPMTLCFKLSHVDTDRMPSRKEITELYHKARDEGRIHCLREDVLMFEWFEPDVFHFNTTRIIHKSGTSGSDLSAAEIEGRSQVREFLEFFRRDVPGFENARIHSVAHHIGIRETRRIKGLAWITVDDYRNCSKFADSIARVHYFLDIHNPDGSGTERLRLPDDDWYEIPFGCVVARDVRNLLIGGRPISTDHGVHSSMRVMPPACTVGQAAGLGAATAARQGSSAHEVDGRAIHDKLIAQGASL
jgi:hypothetical protein